MQEARRRVPVTLSLGFLGFPGFRVEPGLRFNADGWTLHCHGLRTLGPCRRALNQGFRLRGTDE